MLTGTGTTGTFLTLASEVTLATMTRGHFLASILTNTACYNDVNINVG